MAETPYLLDDIIFIQEKKINIKEFVNLQGYYLILKYINNDIIMIFYNIKDLDGIKYELKMKLDDIYKLNNIFKIFNSIEEIYNAIIKLIDEN